jgi:molybdopterin molybdotransferase
LAGVGIDRVNVFPNPVIDIIITGNELQRPGNPLAYGEVFESNSFTLAAALKQLGITTVQCSQVGDNPIQIQQALQTALDRSDLILLTGGVSVGDYDFVSAAARDCGVKTLFHRIRQRPGKPIYAGKWKDKLVFGLPGNPSSVLTCLLL